MSKNKIEPDIATEMINIYPQINSIKVSFLFVTYNRAPSSNFELNPITWAFKSLIPSFKYIDEFVVIVDGSTDFTLENLNWIKNKYKLNLKIIERKDRKGCSYSRKEGIEMISNELFFMGDDDCIYSKHFVIGSLFYYFYLKEKTSTDPVIVAQPIFDLSIDFRQEISEGQIGKTDFKNTWFYHNFDSIPLGRKNIKINNKLSVYNPIEIETFKGVTLTRKSPIIQAGNFLDLSMWKNDYSEHIEISTRLNKFGGKMYYIPDILISCVHLRFGTPNISIEKKLINHRFDFIDLSFGDMLELSKRYAEHTGCRVNDEDFLFTKIGSFLSFYLKLDESIAFAFIKMEYDALMNEKKFETDQNTDGINKEYRLKIWQQALEKGVEITEVQTGKQYTEFKSKVNKFYLFKVFN
jgi:GT2 family glycosyltransferase